MDKKKILLIEDDVIIRENTSELIELMGYEIETAENGLVGVEKTYKFKPDLIVCDIMMPELDGYGVLHILSKNPETATIPFIFLTAKSEKEDLRKGMDLGADDYLFKPFESSELLKAIEKRLEKSELLKQQFSNTNDLHSFLSEAKKVVSLEEIKEQSHSFHFSAKEYVFKEGEHVHFVYYIEKGSVKTFRYNTDGKEYITQIFNEGDFFGFQPVFEDKLHDEVAETLLPTELVKISKKDFLTLIYENRDVAQKFINIISKNLSSKEQDLILMAYSSVKKRVSKKIQELANNNGELILSRVDLAKLTGTTKESLTRTLTEFKKSDLIVTDGKKIIIKDLEKLQHMDMLW